MIAVLILAVLATASLAVAYGERIRRIAADSAHTTELAAINKVGKWYEERVQALEEETTLLAAQVVNGGAVPIRNAMPRDPRDDGEYAFDPTGLVVERLDPRDLPVS